MSNDPFQDALLQRIKAMQQAQQQASQYAAQIPRPSPNYYGGGLGSSLGAPLPNMNPTNNRRKFQDGDRVVFKKDGNTGTVDYYQDDGWGNGLYRVVFDDGRTADMRSVDLDPEAKVKKNKVTLESVILSDEKKEQIKAAISQVEHNDKIFNEWGFSEVFEKGTAIALLFWGIPGTGKTLMAQAIADHFSFTLKMYGPAEIESSEPGGAERAMQSIFKDAKAKKNQVLLFDECDSLLTDRNELGPILSAQVNTLLAEIERFDGIIIFTTNRLGKLDPALERRITTKVEFPFPDKKQRKEIWERMIPKKAPLAKDVDLKKLAEYPLAGGNIKNAVLNAARRAAYLQVNKIAMAHFEDAIEKEAESLQAFAAEYEKQPHQQQVFGGVGMGMGKKMIMTKKMTEGVGNGS